MWARPVSKKRCRAKGPVTVVKAAVISVDISKRLPPNVHRAHGNPFLTTCVELLGNYCAYETPTSPDDNPHFVFGKAAVEKFYKKNIETKLTSGASFAHEDVRI